MALAEELGETVHLSRKYPYRVFNRGSLDFDCLGRFSYYAEYPIQYSLETGQLVSGWIDLLLETDKGFVLIDHKASPRSRSDWNEIALSYSGQLDAYADGIAKVSGKPVISLWIHFAIMAGLVEVSYIPPAELAI